MSRVLLADASVSSARALARLLREDGFDVSVATDGATAVSLLSGDEPVSALVTELVLPHAGGLALAQYGRTRHPGMGVVFVTGRPEFARVNGHWEGPEPIVVAKPVDYAALRDALELVCAPVQQRSIA